MKYTYIICMALSSFFTYKLLYADTNTYLNTFFIPSNAFQQNTQTADIEQMKPRHKEVAPSPKQPDTTEISRQSASSAAPKTPKSTPKTTVATNKPTPKTNNKPQAKQASEQQRPVTKQKKQNPSKYTLQDDSTPHLAPTAKEPEPTTDAQRDFEEKSVREMLDSLPSPNFKLPKYQQIYALYGLELRSTHRRGKLPANYEQEQTISKANSIRRFDVK